MASGQQPSGELVANKARAPDQEYLHRECRPVGKESAGIRFRQVLSVEQEHCRKVGAAGPNLSSAQ